MNIGKDKRKGSLRVRAHVGYAGKWVREGNEGKGKGRVRMRVSTEVWGKGKGKC
jgi:hypothetical protein